MSDNHQGWRYKKEYLDGIEALENIHLHDEQIGRQIRAKSKKCTPWKLDKAQQSAEFQDPGYPVYKTTLDVCTCKDFVLRRLPCKHMYRLAYELGLFSLDNIQSSDACRAVEIFDYLLKLQDDWIARQKEILREKIEKNDPPTKKFSLKRQNSLLREPLHYAKDWFFCVPQYFNDALDIALFSIEGEHRWSQGSTFSFSAGDSIYDIPFEAGRPWSEDLKTLNICLEIEKASPVDVLGEGDDAYRFPGSVECTVFTPDENRQSIVARGQVTMTQDEFVRMLITGANEKISPFLPTKFDAKGQGLLF